MPVQLWPLRTDARLGSNDVLAGRYRLDSFLGQGGAADVFGGFDLRLRRPVAVKVFRPGTDAQTEERFTEEAVTLAGLQHPGLVTVFDSGREAGSPYLVMQLIAGSTLRARAAAGVLGPAEVCALGAALADALDHVHAAGVVHRDVKPSNILLDETGAPHLTDFGISRLMDSTARTATGALVGTAAYLAPEQVLGQTVGPAADVYALGLTLLECLKGELEYDGTPLEAAIARLHRAPAFPSFLDDGLAALLSAMTALDEHDRPDARTCADAFAALSKGEAPVGVPAQAGPVGQVPDGHDTARTFSAGPGAYVADEGASPGRRVSGRTLATAGAVLAALLGVTLTGMVGLADGPDAAAGPENHVSAAPGASPSDSSAASPGPRTEPASESPSARDGKRSGSPSARDGKRSGTSAAAVPAARKAPGPGHRAAGPAHSERQGKAAPQHKAPKKQKTPPGKHKAPK
ncbi:serine/threonine-protein kinase [Streptomyces sp. NPDC004082]